MKKLSGVDIGSAAVSASASCCSLSSSAAGAVLLGVVSPLESERGMPSSFCLLLLRFLSLVCLLSSCLPRACLRVSLSDLGCTFGVSLAFCMGKCSLGRSFEHRLPFSLAIGRAGAEEWTGRDKQGGGCAERRCRRRVESETSCVWRGAGGMLADSGERGAASSVLVVAAWETRRRRSTRAVELC